MDLLAPRVAQRFLQKRAEEAHGRSVALMKFLSAIARHLGVAEHVYVVGGAVRNFLIGMPIKDVDVVVDSVNLKGKDSEWFAKQVADAIPVRTHLKTNQYGVALLMISDPWKLEGHDMKGEIIEIANARKESYGGSGGKGYKPDTVEPATIKEDIERRDFGFNTLLWRMLDLADGPDRAEVIDLTGLGRQHLEERILSTPVDPDKTFSDDPTRMLRAIKFVAKYGFSVPSEIAGSIRRNAPKLKQMPWDAVRKLLVDDILEGPSPRKSVGIMRHLGLTDVLKEMLHEQPGFATALSRSLNEADTHLLLDLLDLGWVVKTPLAFLARDQQVRLREILLQNADSPEFEKRFMAYLLKPPIDQARLFARFNIPLRERGLLMQLARNLLLDDPGLSADVGRLETEMEGRLQTRYVPV
jgi:tRNA nucleotidyltransferase/poly(A) polymerase